MPRLQIKETEYGAGIEWPIVWRAELANLAGEIVQETDRSDIGDPRDADNLGSIVHWHRRYDIASDAERVTGNFQSIRHIARYLGIVRRAVAIIPLGMIDHSGISFYAGSGAHMCDPGGWDSGHVGFVYVTAERAAELCGTGPDGALYKPAGYAGTAREWLESQLREEVRALDAYARGEVYHWRVTDSAGEVLDACGGYLAIPGDAGSDGLEDVRGEVRDSLRWHAAERARADRAERNERARASRAGIPTMPARCTA